MVLTPSITASAGVTGESSVTPVSISRLQGSSLYNNDFSDPTRHLHLLVNGMKSSKMVKKVQRELLVKS